MPDLIKKILLARAESTATHVPQSFMGGTMQDFFNSLDAPDPVLGSLDRRVLLELHKALFPDCTDEEVAQATRRELIDLIRNSRREPGGFLDTRVRVTRCAAGILRSSTLACSLDPTITRFTGAASKTRWLPRRRLRAAMKTSSGVCAIR
ncbi:hypothetical protein [Glutamicibacter arilaitensis]|uniref:hypothetical protein n=1 Tax=Glutamicibacter arilaitensis TaxID=256701 RepID=UPI003F8EEEE1